MLVIFATFKNSDLKNSVESKESREGLIIAAAQRRFGIYGFEKTSMREVAEDLHMSKASLYYYFTDKENLYKSVIEKEQSEFLTVVRDDIRKIEDPSEYLRLYALKRLSYFRTLLNLSRVRSESFHELQPLISVTMAVFRQHEEEIIVEVLEKGKRSGKFYYNDAQKTASLFLDLLRGLRSAFLSSKKLFVIDDEEYDLLSAKVKDFSSVFIRGLMYNDNI